MPLLLRGSGLATSSPLHYLLLKPLLLVLGDPQGALRLLSATSGAAAVPLVARVGERLFDRATGLAACLLAVSPYPWTASLTWAVVDQRQAHKPQWREVFAWVRERCAPGHTVAISGYESRS